MQKQQAQLTKEEREKKTDAALETLTKQKKKRHELQVYKRLETLIRLIRHGSNRTPHDAAWIDKNFYRGTKEEDETNAKDKAELIELVIAREK